MTNIRMQLLHMLSLLWPSQQRGCTAQHARDINIHSLHPLPEKIGLGCADFLHCGTGYIEIAAFVLLLIFCRFQSEFFRTTTACSEKKFNQDFNHKIFCTMDHPFNKTTSNDADWPLTTRNHCILQILGPPSLWNGWSSAFRIW